MKNHEALKINIELIASEPVRHTFGLFKELANENEKKSGMKEKDVEAESGENGEKDENGEKVENNGDKDQNLFFGVSFDGN